jgi:aryl-alcohol dehydrogenase-like predicted oxidoreductase
MQYRTFGGDALQVSEVGLGTWQLGAEWGDVDDATAEQVLASAVESGVTFFDTADVYGLGKSETRIGKFLKKLGSDAKKITVATKLGRFPEPGWPANFTYETFRQHTEASLRRLSVESLDLTQTHCLPHERMRSGEMFDWLRRLKKEGKIKRFGASVETIAEAETCLAQDGLASLQIIFNVFRPQWADAFFAKAASKGVALIIRLPLASGLLSGKFTESSTFPENDHRNFNRDGQRFNVGETFAGLPLAKGVEAVGKLREFLPAGTTLTQFAMRWILDHPQVSTIIPGAKSRNQVLENGSASDLPALTPKLHRQIRSYFDREVAPHVRGPQ